MRILIVSQYFWPEPFRINDLALGLKERGHEVTVLTGVPNYPEGRIYPGYGLFSSKDTYAGIPIIRVPLLPRGRSKGMRLIANYISFFVMASVLGLLRTRGKFDGVFAFEPSPITVGIPAILLKWRHRAPLLFWVLDLWPDTLTATGAVRSPWVLQQVDRLVRWVYRHSDRVLTQSRGFIPFVQNQDVPLEKICYFPSWAEDVFRPVQLPADAPERQEMPPGFRIVFAGNIGVSQSFGTILDAAERTRHIPEIQWVILGDGRERAWVQQQVQSRRLERHVTLLGRRPMETMPRYFSLADALLVTLKREPIFALTIPAKVQDYLACGKPILASLDGEGAAIIQESQAGLVSPCEDGRALAEHAMQLYRAAAGERAEMGRRARRYYEENFERQRLLDRLEEQFREVAGEGASTRAPRRAA